MGLDVRTPKQDILITTQSGATWALDATTSESVTSEAEVTENGVEEGVDVADHVHRKPKMIRLTGVVSASPIDDTKQYPARLIDLYNQLLAIQDRDETVELVGTLGIFPTCILTSISARYAPASEGDLISFDIAAKEVRFARAETVQILNTLAEQKKNRRIAKLKADLAAQVEVFEMRQLLAAQYFGNPDITEEQKRALEEKLRENKDLAKVFADGFTFQGI